MQTLILMMTCMTGGPREDSRDPARVLETLDRCGFRIEYADLVSLPYSFTRYDYGYNRTTWNTLVARAIRELVQLRWNLRRELASDPRLQTTVDHRHLLTSG